MKLQNNSSYQVGFTLVELVLVMAIISLIAIIGTPIAVGVLNRQRINNNAFLLHGALYQAQSLSRSAANDSGWGVHINSNLITVFSGDSYATRDTNLDIPFTFSGAPEITGNTEILFGKLSGIPASAATINISMNNNTIITNVNSVGTITY